MRVLLGEWPGILPPILLLRQGRVRSWRPGNSAYCRISSFEHFCLYGIYGLALDHCPYRPPNSFAPTLVYGSLSALPRRVFSPKTRKRFFIRPPPAGTFPPTRHCLARRFPLSDKPPAVARCTSWRSALDRRRRFPEHLSLS